MKTATLFRTLFLTLCTLCVTACGEDEKEPMIWDFYPFTLYVRLVDKADNDLLDSKTENNLTKKKITATYRGTAYERDVPVAPGRAYMPHFYGLQTGKDAHGDYWMTFGEFGGDDEYTDEQVTVRIGDTSIAVITFSNKVTWKSENDPVTDRKFFLDGKQTNNYGEFTIVVDPSLL